MNIVLWTLQVLLALMFTGAGTVKLVQPREKLVRTMAWVATTPQQTVRLIGTIEVLGALGLVLPALTGILPWLTPSAAVGLGLTMIGAAMTNLRLNKPAHIAANAGLFGVAMLIAYGRFVLVPI